LLLKFEADSSATKETKTKNLCLVWTLQQTHYVAYLHTETIDAVSSDEERKAIRKGLTTNIATLRGIRASQFSEFSEN
jgi:hypothetical protein